MDTTVEKKPYYVYLLHCCDGTLYTGIAVDVNRRVAVHNRGKGARYTRSRLPVRVVYQEQWDSRSDALVRERQIKAFSRAQKLALAAKGRSAAFGLEEEDKEKNTG